MIGLWRLKLPRWLRARRERVEEELAECDAGCCAGERAQDWEWHRKMGAHSNIPECCVEAWIRDRQAGHWNMVKLRGLVEGNGWEYIPCEVCLRDGYQQQIHDCDPLDPVCAFLVAPEQVF